MSQYGEILYESEFIYDKIYDAFVDYFDNPIMTKIRDVNYHSLYISKTYCLLNKQCRYIMVFVEEDNLPIFTKQQLMYLRWKSLQTRTLEEQYNIKSHHYKPKRSGILSSIITKKNTDNEKTTYYSDELPIIITLLNSNNEYQNKGNIISAIETYNTIITISSNL